MHAECDIVLAISSVCLSVCPSNAGTVSKLMHISSQFLTVWSGHYSIFFEPKRRYKIPRGIPSRGVKYMGWENFANIVFFISQKRDRPLVTMDH